MKEKHELLNFQITDQDKTKEFLKSNIVGKQVEIEKKENDLEIQDYKLKEEMKLKTQYLDQNTKLFQDHEALKELFSATEEENKRLTQLNLDITKQQTDLRSKFEALEK